MASRDDEISNYPFLTQDEFRLACHLLDQKYIAATLGQDRRIFRLRLQHSMISGSVSISITKPIEISKDDVTLSLDLEALNWGGGRVETWTSMDVDAEEADGEALRPKPHSYLNRNMNTPDELDGLPAYSPQAQQPYAIYEIHLHPTYQTPVLWFSLHDLPPCDLPFDIETVYRYLVPDRYKDHLRSVGVIGGISAANHPVTDVPAFFIHPCSTKEAMEQFHCSLKDYLGIWLGLVGGYIGLWLPPAMA